eukprot:SM000334S12538  [mRNA]  locus=s334:22604:23683:+ [translate_table: standard]
MPLQLASYEDDRGRIMRVADLTLGIDKVLSFQGSNTLITIPPRVPHLFEFLEESFVIEWWECSFHAWYYKPYRDLIEDVLSQPA